MPRRRQSFTTMTASEKPIRRRLTNALILLFAALLVSVTLDPMFTTAQTPPNGVEAYKKGQALWEEQKYEEAAKELWTAVLMHSATPDGSYNVQEVFSQFLQCYSIQGKIVDGLAFVAAESFQRGQIEMGKNYLQQALSMDPKHPAAVAVQEQFGVLMDGGGDTSATPGGGGGGGRAATSGSKTNKDLEGKSPESLYEVGSEHFAKKEYEECADVFEISCQRSGNALGPSCANAVYCRNMIADWGFNGTQFERDMERITKLIQDETEKFRMAAADDSRFVWKRATSVHPHMTLGYPIDPMLKRYVTESVAYMDEQMARISHSKDGTLPPLPDGLPYDPSSHRERIFQKEAPDTRIRVGFVGSGFNSKAVLYLSQDMFRFFDSSKFEIHVFSMGPPDDPMFIEHAMRGVDWRKRVEANVEFFHDCQALKWDHIQLARFIHDQHVHILIEWDGYARQGDRAQGLFALRPAPVQILHQEYLGTSGALYVDYLFSDMITSPTELENLYTEKLIYMPNHFFSKGHALQAEVKKPTYEYLPREKKMYQLGRGSPQENRCMAPPHKVSEDPSFVFCNFNKVLKNNPETVQSWIRILREVPNSMLCLLENPTTATPYFRKYVHEAAGTSKNNSDLASFVGGDGDDLNRRIHFLPWSANPFDHQARNQDFCNAMLDSYPYNGHTVAQDALYAGVPIVTRSDGQDMASRVSTSANVVLGLEQLNAYEGPRQYEDIAIRLGTDPSEYEAVRTKLIDSALQRNPMHPYWDVARYVKNVEAGLEEAWNRFLSGDRPDHIRIQESETAAKGTYDEEIFANPPEGKKASTESAETGHSDEL